VGSHQRSATRGDQLLIPVLVGNTTNAPTAGACSKRHVEEVDLLSVRVRVDCVRKFPSRSLNTKEHLCDRCGKVRHERHHRSVYPSVS
jgi:hypothetical protein